MQPQYITLAPNAKDITGQRFSSLVALGPIGRNMGRQIVWLCQCDCGNTPIVSGSLMLRGHTKSCGCVGRKKSSERLKTHGMSKTRALGTYLHMIDRCHNTESAPYHYYGGRGITVCKEWRESFVTFAEYIMALPHYDEKGYSLDRIDNNGNYEPDNVRWATQQQQTRNTRRNILITHDGRTQCIKDWAKECNMFRGTLETRLKAGWSIERALTEQSHREGVKLSPDDVPEIRRLAQQGVTQDAISKQFGISRSHVRDIVHRKTWARIK